MDARKHAKYIRYNRTKGTPLRKLSIYFGIFGGVLGLVTTVSCMYGPAFNRTKEFLKSLPTIEEEQLRRKHNSEMKRNVGQIGRPGYFKHEIAERKKEEARLDAEIEAQAKAL